MRSWTQLDRVAGARRRALDREGDVHRLLRQHARVALGLELRLTGGDRLVDLTAARADELAGLRLVRTGQRADPPVGEGQGAAVPRVLGTDGLQRVEVAGLGDVVEGGLDRGVECRLVERIDGCLLIGRGHACLPGGFGSRLGPLPGDPVPASEV